MKTSIALLSLVLLFSSSNAFAFNKERCGHLFPQADSDHPYYYAPIYVTTMIPSTTSYFSSIGPCGMYADYQSSNRVSFVEDTLPAIRIDAARGEGEYLKTLAQLSGCPAEEYAKVASVMHKNFETVFAANDSGEAPVQRIDTALKAEPTLKKSCSLLN